MKNKRTHQEEIERLALDKKLNGWSHANMLVESKGEVDKTVDFSSMYPKSKTN